MRATYLALSLTILFLVNCPVLIWRHPKEPRSILESVGLRRASSSAYFFHLERKQAADAWGSALRESDGTIVSSPDDLCHSFASSFSYLFTASSTDPVAQETLLDKVSATLSSDQAKQCEGMLSTEECHAAFIGMAKQKAPRIDAFPMEFYVKF